MRLPKRCCWSLSILKTIVCPVQPEIVRNDASSRALEVPGRGRDNQGPRDAPLADSGYTKHHQAKHCPHASQGVRSMQQG